MKRSNKRPPEENIKPILFTEKAFYQFIPKFFDKNYFEDVKEDCKKFFENDYKRWKKTATWGYYTYCFYDYFTDSYTQYDDYNCQNALIGDFNCLNLFEFKKCLLEKTAELEKDLSVISFSLNEAKLKKLTKASGVGEVNEFFTANHIDLVNVVKRKGKKYNLFFFQIRLTEAGPGSAYCPYYIIDFFD